MKHIWEKLNVNLKYVRKNNTKKVVFVPKYITRKSA